MDQKDIPIRGRMALLLRSLHDSDVGCTERQSPAISAIWSTWYLAVLFPLAIVKCIYNEAFWTGNNSKLVGAIIYFTSVFMLPFTRPCIWSSIYLQNEFVPGSDDRKRFSKRDACLILYNCKHSARRPVVSRLITWRITSPSFRESTDFITIPLWVRYVECSSPDKSLTTNWCTKHVYITHLAPHAYSQDVIPFSNQAPFQFVLYTGTSWHLLIVPSTIFQQPNLQSRASTLESWCF